MEIDIDKKSVAELNCWRIALLNKPSLIARPLDCATTMVVVIDMVNGFASKGALASPRVAALIEPIEQALELLPNAKKVFLRDEHDEHSVELSVYPPHCTTKKESAVVKELERFVDVSIAKNSTNGIFAFLKALETDGYHNFLIMGDCTDICILQFALSLRAYLNENNSTAAVSVFTDYVDTFDSSLHNADLNNLFALKNMEDNGISIFRRLANNQASLPRLIVRSDIAR